MSGLGHLSFILHTVPLISQSSAQHLLFTDDIQLFLSFSAADFPYNITQIKRTVSKVLGWISSNFLSFNSSKIEFLLIGLQQLIDENFSEFFVNKMIGLDITNVDAFKFASKTHLLNMAL